MTINTLFFFLKRRMTTQQFLVKKVKPTNYLIAKDLEDMDLSRVGVFPYAFHDDKLYFMVGIDKKYKEYCDFGGGIEKNDKTSLHGGLREFIEETNESLPSTYYTINKLRNSLAIVVDGKYGLVFVRGTMDQLLKAAELFTKQISDKRERQECSSLKILDETKFKSAFFHDIGDVPAWNFLCKFLKNIKNWNEFRRFLATDLSALSSENYYHYDWCEIDTIKENEKTMHFITSKA